MQHRRSSVSYRVKKSRVGKKLKSHTRLLFVIGGVLIAMILTVIWGLIWGEKAQKSALARTEAKLQEQALAAAIPDWLPTQPDPIRASYLGKITTLADATAAAATLAEGGATALSVPLYADGTPQYNSPAAQALGRQTENASDVTLARLFASILNENCRIAATFACDWQNEVDPALRRVARTYEAALVAEIATAGADEVLLTGLAISEESLSEVALFLREIRESAPDAVIGVSLPTALMLSDTRVEIARILLSWVDHLALDLSDYDTHTVSVTAQDGTVTRESTDLPQILDLLDPAIRRYRMRLILPVSMYEHLITVQELGYDNWQIIR
jgi:hypothetical protein